MKASYRKSTNIFTYYNRNPKGKLRGSDCVARAISTATGMSWETVIRDITELGIKLGSVFNEKSTYAKWLELNGWVKMPQPRKINNTKYTLAEFLKLCPKGIYIVNLANHLTVVEDGIVYDTWDCTRKTVGNYWTK